MSFGKMRARIALVRTDTVKDAEGFSQPVDKVLAHVRAYMEERHGSEKWANRAAFSEATALFRFRRIPHVDVSPALVILCDGCRYGIVSVEDVKGRGLYLEALAKKVEATDGKG